MHLVFALVLTLAALIASGCSISDPTTTSSDETPPAQTEPSRSRVPDRLPGARGARSPRQAVVTYGALVVSFESDNSAQTLERALGLGDRELAALTLARYQSAAATANTDAPKQAGEVIAVDVTRVGRAAAAFAVVRQGRYLPNGALVGSSSLHVYSAALAHAPTAGWILTSWRPAK